MNISVLGPGCKNCHTLKDHTQKALQALGRTEQVESITDPVKIAGHGVMRTPALMVNGQVVSMGRVLAPQSIVEILKQHAD
ncbi:thioredoxin family protein [Deinococcus misasensis]|uniref:thioredoxin family protein n=1 Tax=Deinococcus misasensis TaxID=392413 RepID=UPI000558416D|nr:thioredoxin family protein [Deinococcus misasensis]